MSRLKKELVDQPLHIALTAPLLLIGFFPGSWWSYAVVAFWIGLLREDAQHRKSEGWWWLLPWEHWLEYDLEEDDGGGVVLTGWKDVGGFWRWVDIGFTTIGGGIVGAVVEAWG